MKRLSLLWLLILNFTISCNKHDTPTTKYEDITSYMREVNHLNNFLYALNKVRAKSMIDKYGNTIIAPNDKAFEKYFYKNGYSSIEDVPVNELEQIVRLGIVQEPIFLSKEGGYYKTMCLSSLSSKDYVCIYAQDNSGTGNSGSSSLPASILSANVTNMQNLANTHLFEIDQVLDEPSIYDLIKHNDQLKQYKRSIDALDEKELKNKLDQTGNITIFASDNDFVLWYFKHLLNTIDVEELFPVYHKEVDIFLQHQIKWDGAKRLKDNNPGAIITEGSEFDISPTNKKLFYHLRNHLLTLEEDDVKPFITIQADVVASNGYLNIIKFDKDYLGPERK